MLCACTYLSILGGIPLDHFTLRPPVQCQVIAGLYFNTIVLKLWSNCAIIIYMYMYW